MVKEVKRKKFKKARKPMSAENKAAAIARLAAAREKRMAENPPKFKNIHDTVLSRGEDDIFHFRKVQKWIKTQKELVASARQEVRKNAKGAESKLANRQKYVSNLEKYLRDGVYVDMFYGEHGEHKIKYRCVKPSFDKDGMIKRTHGVFYNDIGTIYLGENTVYASE